MPTRLEWTPELVAKFWDGVATSPALESLSFAKLSGEAFVAFMLPWVREGSRCLDFGGGSGGLVELMTAAGIDTALYEPSAERAAAALPNLSARSGFLGVRSTDDQEQFDLVICSEVIEHVLARDFDGFMNSLVGKIAPDGRVMITTPAYENLELNDCYCPVCDHLFHRWQHQTSWTPSQLEGVMQRWGLTTVWLGEVSFQDPEPILKYHELYAEGGEAQWPHSNGFPYIAPGGQLVYIGERRSEQYLERKDIPAGAVSPFSDGFMWYVRLEGLPRADSPEYPVRSKVTVLEDGQPLGPAHSSHDEIRTLGGGRYSHWGAANDILFFSTSDNSSPLENGRTYSVAFPRRP